MTELRNRLVVEQDGTQTVSGVLLAADEIHEALDWEVQLHLASGWDVRRYGATLRFWKNGTVRWVWVRSRPPHEDTLA